jgi:predicted RNase H-like HicB family nuclease
LRYLIVLEQTESGFAVQVPDLAISTFGETIESAKHAASQAIEANLNAYQETGHPVPEKQPTARHLENPDFQDLLFAYVDVNDPEHLIAA